MIVSYGFELESDRSKHYTEARCYLCGSPDDLTLSGEAFICRVSCSSYDVWPEDL